MKRLTLTLAIATSCTTAFAMGPRARSLNEEMNHILSIYPNIAVTDTSGITTKTAMEEVVYYDGIGRPIEEIHRGGNSAYTDIVTLRKYDGFGREAIIMLPSTGTGTGAYIGEDTYTSNAASLYSSDPFPYTTTTFEPSHSSRPLTVSGPGMNWRNAGIQTKYEYMTTYGSGERHCRKFSVSGERGSHSLIAEGYYGVGKLSVTRMTDEDGRVSLTFTDSEEKTILSRAVLDDGYADTYYVYDDYGNLCYVLPPEGTRQWEAGEQDSAIDRYGYQYRYDERNRCTAKKFPGVGWTYYVYDTHDRLIFVQDGNMRELGKWLMTLYDVSGREVMKGLYGGEVSSSEISMSDMTAEHTGASGTLRGYALPACITPSHISLTEVMYYDDYDNEIGTIASNVSSVFGFEEREGFEPSNDTRAKGLLTGRFIFYEDSSGCIPQIFYYDGKGRQIQTRNSLRHSVMTAYDFKGNPVRTHEEVISGSDTTWVRTEYAYKHNGLLDTLTFTTSGEGLAQMAYGYDNINRLTSVRYGNLNDAFTYNLRGWAISKDVTLDTNRIFRMNLRYESPSSDATAAQYGGNISEWEWFREPSDTLMYSFTYDRLSRLSDSRLMINGTADSGFKESGISYDLNGNMLGMTRTDASGMAETLAYSYDGNKLSACTYDSNGNMTYDADSGLSLEWNSLNLIKKVSNNSGVLVNYSYLADGTKVRAVDADGEGLEYRGSLTFRRAADGTLTPESIAFSGGRIVAVTGEDGQVQMIPQYHVTDHLGSVRAIVDGGTDQITETNDYYAFGGRWDRSGSLVDQANRYRYNGKEEQAIFGTPYIDYGARQYSAVTGRWLAMDPMAEKYYGISPYAFCNNNPVNYVDPDGRDIWELKSNGEIRWVESSEEDRLYTVDDGGNRTNNYITIGNRDMLNSLSEEKEVVSYSNKSNIDDMFKLFKFAADNTEVEWALHRGHDNTYTIGTKHQNSTVGNWEEFGIEKPLASVHSHPGIATNLYDERYSMGIDWNNVKNDFHKNGKQTRMNYVYFPNSNRLYHVENDGVRYIRSISKNFKQLYFGALNHK